MINNVLRVAIYCLVFLSIQVLVLNNIHFLRLATPFLYVYILLKMPVGTQPVRLLLLAFFTGLVVDSFTNTAGMHAAACCLAAFARTPGSLVFFERKDRLQASLAVAAALLGLAPHRVAHPLRPALPRLPHPGQHLPDYPLDIPR